MSKTTPADLAVTFRGFPRRLALALEDCEDGPVWSGHRTVGDVLDEAARLLHTGAEPAIIADAIAGRHVEDWSEEDLERLRTLALRLGSLVRQAESWRDESPRDTGDD